MADAKIPANKFVTVLAVITADTAIWTPAAGKRIRVLGWALALTVTNSVINFKENGAGSVIFQIPQPTGLSVPINSNDMGNGFTLGIGLPLTAIGGAGTIVAGTIWGCEE